jgi:hypothetical protein
MHRLFWLGVFALALAWPADAGVVTALHAPATTGFSIGAGMAIDPPAPTPFDNRLAQTFTAVVSGRPATASIVAYSGINATAPLRLDIVSWNVNQVVDVLATGYLAPSAFSTDYPQGPLSFSPAASLSGGIDLIAGHEYALVLWTETSDANYGVFGKDGNLYAGGEAYRSQNTSLFTPMLSGSDLFFEVTVTPEPSCGMLLCACASSLLAVGRRYAA